MLLIITMNQSNNTFDELFDQTAADAALESFNFTQLPTDNWQYDGEAQPGLYSEDPNQPNQQMSYSDMLNDEFQTGSLFNVDSHASSTQPNVQQPVSPVHPESLFLSSPSQNFDSDLNLVPGLQDLYSQEQVIQEPHRCANLRSLELAPSEQEILSQDNMEQVGAEQDIVEQIGYDALIFTDIFQEADNQNASQVVKNDDATRNPKAGLNLRQQALDGKTAKRIRKAKNLRAANIAGFVAAEHFIPLPETPLSWGQMNPATGHPMYEYSPQGELIPHLKYNEQQIRDYLANHPLHIAGLLTLWVQICPADSGNRYPNKNHSSRCRFENCMAPHRQIAIGEYRVAFDEQSWKYLPLDPFHNAGYVHLFCLEKHFDFPQLCNDLNVQPDTRSAFAGKKSRMAITRDHPEMETIVKDFIRDSKPWNGSKKPDKWYRESLCYALTVEQLKREPRKRQRIREERDGNSIEKHMGNLDLQKENKARRKAGLPWKYFERPVVENSYAKKRKPEDDDEEEVVVEADPESNQAEPAAKKRKTTRQASHVEKPQTKKRNFDDEEESDEDDDAGEARPLAKTPRITQQASRFEKSHTKKRKSDSGEEARKAWSLAKKPRTRQQTSLARRPRTMKRKFDEEEVSDEETSDEGTSDEEESGQARSSAKKGKITQPTSRVKKPVPKPILPMKRKPQPLRNLKRKPDRSPPAKRPKVIVELSDNDSAYEDDVAGPLTPSTLSTASMPSTPSTPSTPSFEELKEMWRKTHGNEERTTRSTAQVKRQKFTKGKEPEGEEGRGVRTGTIQERYRATMERYGQNKGLKKGDAAGLNTPLGDMMRLPF